MVDLKVKLVQKPIEYRISIDNEPVENLKSKVLEYINGKYAIVISEKVYKLYWNKLGFEGGLVYVLKDGECEKNFKTYKKITEFLLKNGLNRTSTLISIGGGVCGDIAGFVASTFMRGINLIQIPTTLLSQVDSSVGGKTAIDTKYGKNLVGTFYQPKAVFINTNFLDTLDEKQFKSGLGEVLKYGFIEKSCDCKEDFELLKLLDENCEKVLNRDKEIISKIIDICLRLKISIVETDERESDLRRILNFGHTWGHAIEQLTNYKKSHGECVAEGIRYALSKSEACKLIDENYYNFGINLLDRYGFDRIENFNKDKIEKIMMYDKKADNKGINAVLAVGKGQVEIKKI